MADAYGNPLDPPGTSQVAEVKPGDILASYARFTQKGVTLKGGQGVLAAGTVLGRETATKKYLAYDDANSPAGIGVAKGVLRENVDTGPSGAPKDKLGNIIMSGIVKYSKLVGYDANAGTDLNGRVDTDRDWLIF
jgi:hypothetical protein